MVAIDLPWYYAHHRRQEQHQIETWITECILNDRNWRVLDKKNFYKNLMLNLRVLEDIDIQTKPEADYKEWRIEERKETNPQGTGPVAKPEFHKDFKLFIFIFSFPKFTHPIL